MHGKNIRYVLNTAQLCVDFGCKICYHILYRRSDLDVVSSNPEFGHKGLASLMLRCGSYFIREIAP